MQADLYLYSIRNYEFAYEIIFDQVRYQFGIKYIENENAFISIVTHTAKFLHTLISSREISWEYPHTQNIYLRTMIRITISCLQRKYLSLIEMSRSFVKLHKCDI